MQSIIDTAEMVSSGEDGHVTAMERALLLALVLKWHKDSDGFKMEQAREVEKKIWLSHIHSAIEEVEEEKLPVSDNQLEYIL